MPGGPKSLFLKSGWKSSMFGGPNGPLPPQDPREWVGPPFPVGFGEEGAAWTPKIDELRPGSSIIDDFLSASSCYSMLHNSASGPEIGLPGWILAGLPPERHQNRPSGRPKAGRRADFYVFPVAVRPKCIPEGRCLDRKHYCVT